jgi:ABC-type antimicrobial peptide transport system permease subunit
MVEPKNESPLTKLWHQFTTNNLSVVCLYEFMKLATLVIVQVMEVWMTKSTLWNRLVRHLNITIHMFIQDFYTKETFPFHQAIAHWNDVDKAKVTMNV